MASSVIKKNLVTTVTLYNSSITATGSYSIPYINNYDFISVLVMGDANNAQSFVFPTVLLRYEPQYMTVASQNNMYPVGTSGGFSFYTKLKLDTTKLYIDQLSIQGWDHISVKVVGIK